MELVAAICLMVLLICLPRVIWRNERFIEDLNEEDFRRWRKNKKDRSKSTKLIGG